MRKRTYGVVGDHIIRARKINLLVKILEILSTLQQDNTSRIGHSFEIALLDTVTFHFDRSNVFIDKGEKMSYLNGTSKEKFIVPDTEDDILMGTDAGFIDVDYPVRVEASCEVIDKTFEDSAMRGCSLNIIGNTMHNFENSCETTLDSYQYKENDSQVLP